MLLIVVGSAYPSNTPSNDNATAISTSVNPSRNVRQTPATLRSALRDRRDDVMKKMAWELICFLFGVYIKSYTLNDLFYSRFHTRFPARISSQMSVSHLPNHTIHPIIPGKVHLFAKTRNLMPFKVHFPTRAPGCLILLAVLLVFLLAALHIAAPMIAKRVANQQLPEQLQTEAEVGNVRLNLLTGTFGIDNLVVQQPSGFEGDPLLRLQSLDLDLPVGKAIRRDPVVVRNLHLDGLDLHLITHTNAVTNLSRIGPPPSEDPEPETDPAPPPPVWIQDLLLENVRVVLRDHAHDWDLRMEDIHLEIENLRIGHEDGLKEPAQIRLELSLPGEKATGRLLVRAKTGPIHPQRPNQAPPLQIAVGLFGFDLDFIDPFLVPGARTALRGNGLETLIFIQIHPGESFEEQILEGSFLLTSDGGLRIAGPNGGTLAQPKLPVFHILNDLVGNQLGRVTKLGGNLAQGGVEAGITVLKTGGEAVKGAGRTVAQFGGGLFKTAKGIVTLDADRATKGLTEATVGTVNEAAGSLGKTAGAAIAGLAETTSVARGTDDEEEWWANVARREQEFDAFVDTWFADNPFPPAPPSPAAEPENQTPEDNRP